MYLCLRNITTFWTSLIIVSITSIANTIAAPVLNADLMTNLAAISFFDNLAKLKSTNPSDEEYYEPLYPMKDEKKGLWGFKNYKDKWAIKPVFDEVEEFGEDECAKVRFAGFWGVISRNRSFAILPINKDIQRSSVPGFYISYCPTVLWEEFANNSYSKRREEVLKQATITDQISIVIWSQNGIPLKNVAFDTVQDFDNNRNAIVSTSSGYGLLNCDGNYIVEPQFHNISAYTSEFYKVDDNGTYGLVNSYGDTVLPTEFDIIEDWKQDALIWARFSFDGKWIAMDSHGSIVVDSKLDEKPTWDNMSQAIVKSNDMYGILDSKGVLKIECNNQYIEKIGNEYWTVKIMIMLESIGLKKVACSMWRCQK